MIHETFDNLISQFDGSVVVLYVRSHDVDDVVENHRVSYLVRVIDTVVFVFLRVHVSFRR